MDARCGAVRVLLSRRARPNVPPVSRTALHASPPRALKAPPCQRLSDSTKPASSLSRSSGSNATLLEFCRRRVPGTVIGLVYCLLLYTPSGLAGEAGNSVALQVDAYTDAANAEHATASLTRAGFPVFIESSTDTQGRRLIRVLVGPYLTREHARSTKTLLILSLAAASLRQAGFPVVTEPTTDKEGHHDQ